MSDQNKADYDGDGTVSKREADLYIKKIEGQSHMAWVAFVVLCFSGIYLLVFAEESRLTVASSGVFDMYWITLGSIIGFFFGATAYMSKK